MTIAGQEHDASVDIGTDRPGHDNVARHLSTCQGRQFVRREQMAMANGDCVLVLASELSR